MDNYYSEYSHESKQMRYYYSKTKDGCLIPVMVNAQTTIGLEIDRVLEAVRSKDATLRNVWIWKKFETEIHYQGHWRYGNWEKVE